VTKHEANAIRVLADADLDAATGGAAWTALMHIFTDCLLSTDKSSPAYALGGEFLRSTQY